MDLVKITDLVPQLGLTSRSLRYYEEVGLIQSVRLPGEKYRFFDEANIERLKQIIVLRKMMIPIKDILRIYERDDMSVVVEVFVERIHKIDREAAALSELKRITDEFLQVMLRNGVKKISALPLLYEALANQELEKEEERPNGPMTYDQLSAAAETMERPIEPMILQLPSMRVLSSNLKVNASVSDPDGFWHFVQTHGLASGEPGMHERFEYQTDAGDVFILRIADDFVNGSPFEDFIFEGGLFAAANIYLDEDVGRCFRTMIAHFDENKYYQVDYALGGGLRHAALLETLLSPDESRELVTLFIPVKKRLADPSLFRKPREISPDSITVAEIEKANPILWTHDVAMDKMIPLNAPHYRVTEEGEAEYISWISTRVLSTGVAVKLPFRVDIEFRIGEESGGWGHDKNETSIRFHHGEDLNYLFGINMDNSPDERLSQEAICFHQPIFGDYFRYPKRGGINRNAYNHLTWIVGQNHFAVIINGEVRYCGKDFPYMTAELWRQQPRTIIMGSDSSIKKYYRSIRVSQLACIPKAKIRQGALSISAKQSNNSISNIHRFITSEYGENYHFNGCARYVMESLGEYKEEPDFGYWFFAGLTGDILSQVYSYDEYMGECVSSCMFNLEGGGYLEGIFEKCGYASTFVSEKQLADHKELYVRTLMAHIDKGVPVIAVTRQGSPWGIYVGYEEYGKTLLFLARDMTQPECVPIELAIDPQAASEHAAKGWLFVGEKKRTVDLAQMYRNIIFEIPKLFAIKNKAFCFGAEAFRAWADDIENGKAESVALEQFNAWCLHTSNVCNMATNGSTIYTILQRTQELNPDLTFIDEIGKLYKRTAEIWNEDGGRDLEALGGGFNVTLEALQDKTRRGKIAARIREAAECMERVLEIVNEYLGNL